MDRKECLHRIIRNFEPAIVRMIASVLMASMSAFSDNKELYTSIETLDSFTNTKFLVICSIFFLAFTVIEYIMSSTIFAKVTDVLILTGVSFVYGMNIAMHTTNIYYLCIVCLFVLFVFRYVGEKTVYHARRMDLSAKAVKIFVTVVTIAVFVYLCMLVVLRVYIFKPVTFDFGIFVQMFYYMKKCLIPYTTCERFELLSHFTIHFSPFFYLLLPIYAIFPSAYTLVVVQLIAVVSGIIPLYLICKNHKMPNIMRLALCMTYLLYPSLRGGLFYDFHENKFLAPLVLWLLYFFEKKCSFKKKLLGIVIFTLLILMVKEDAPIYTACIGLYVLLGNKKWKERVTGGIVFVFSIIYFFVVFYFMSKFGDAGSAITSFGRYSNLMGGEYEGVTSIVMNMLKNPAYVMSQLLTQTKLEFLIWMFAPLLFLPFRIKEMAGFVLMIPMLVLNLLSNYKYQHSIYFQYTYASGVLLIYLAVLAANNLRPIMAKKMAVSMIAVSLIFGTGAISDKNIYFDDYVNYKDSIEEVRDLLASIPKEGVVCATTTYVPVLAQRDEVYSYREGDTPDYLVFSLAGSDGKKNENIIEKYLNDGYHQFGIVEEKVIVLEKS